jgi:uracil-DNA glycosylase
MSAGGTEFAQSPGERASIRLESSWKSRVGDWLLRPEMRALAAFLRAE